MMSDGRGNFYRTFDMQSGSFSGALHDLLQIPNVSLMRLLDDQSFLSEFKGSTSRIRQFMTYKRFKTLVELVTVVGDPMDKKRSFKFPLTACEMLSSDSTIVFAKLVPEGGTVKQEEKNVQSVQEEIDVQVQDDGEDETSPQVKEIQAASSQAKAEQDQEDEFGEFVQARQPKMKIVKMKQVVQKTVINQKTYPPLVDSLVGYFSSELNYTLTGYVCKILLSLLNKRPSQVLPLLLKNHQQICTHMASRSVSELIVRLCSMDSPEMIQQRVEVALSLIKQLSIADPELSNCFGSCFCEIFEKIAAQLSTPNSCKELSQFYNKSPQMLLMLTQIINNSTQEHSATPFACVLQIMESIPQSSQHIILGTGMVSGLATQAALQLSKRDKMGTAGMKLVEFISKMLKYKVVREQASQQPDFLLIFLNLLTTFSLNNILHNQIAKLLKTCLSQELAQNFIKNSDLTAWLLIQAQKYSQSSSNLKGYAGHVIQLCKTLQELTLTQAQSLLKDQKFAQAYRILVEKGTVSQSANLGGYASNRQSESRIVSSKQQALQKHAAFLKGARPPVFQVDPEDPFQNPTLLQQLKKQLDGLSDQPPPASTQDEYDGQRVEDGQMHNQGFWKMHLDYDLDDLMQEVL